MLAALLCGLGLPTPRAREPLFASTISTVQRESRGKNGGAAAEVEVEWCYTNTDKPACDKSYFLKKGVPTRCAWREKKGNYACRPATDEWVDTCNENDESTCDDSYFVTQAGHGRPDQG